MSDRMISAKTVFELACAAQRINGAYLKQPVYDFDVDQRNPVKVANKEMVATWIRENDFSKVTLADQEQSVKVREHFKSYMFLMLANKANEFQRAALQVSQKEEFDYWKESRDIALASSLPSVMERDAARKEFMDMLKEAPTIDQPAGTLVSGDFEVLKCYYNQNYDRYRITGKLGESVVTFFYKDSMNVGDHMSIKGKVKRQFDSGETQLNYVKIITKNG
jgi:hypothetical protein